MSTSQRSTDCTITTRVCYLSSLLRVANGSPPQARITTSMDWLHPMVLGCFRYILNIRTFLLDGPGLECIHLAGEFLSIKRCCSVNLFCQLFQS